MAALSFGIKTSQMGVSEIVRSMQAIVRCDDPAEHIEPVQAETKHC